MTKKVAYLVNQYPKVSHTFIRREIRALEERGFEVARFTVREPPTTVDPEDQAEVARTAVLLHTSARGAAALAGALLARSLADPIGMARALRLALRLGGRSERGRLVHLAYLGEAARLARACRRSGLPHLHAHFGTNSATVALLCEALGGPGFSFTAHGPEEFDKPDLIALEEKIARARFVVGISSFGRSQLLRRAPAREWDKVKVVPCGIDDRYLDEGVVTPVPDVPRLCCVGRLCEQKGQLLLVDAAGVLAREGVRFELVLVGDGEMRAQVEERVRAHGLEDRVRITGWASGQRVVEELRAARAMVLPSFAEGLPVVIMEALALARPVISTYVAGIPELVEPGACGWLVPAGDVDALARAIKDALTRPTEELMRMGREGRARVVARHDARKAAALLEELFSAAASAS